MPARSMNTSSEARSRFTNRQSGHIALEEGEPLPVLLAARSTPLYRSLSPSHLQSFREPIAGGVMYNPAADFGANSNEGGANAGWPDEVSHVPHTSPSAPHLSPVANRSMTGASLDAMPEHQPPEAKSARIFLPTPRLDVTLSSPTPSSLRLAGMAVAVRRGAAELLGRQGSPTPRSGARCRMVAGRRDESGWAAPADVGGLAALGGDALPAAIDIDPGLSAAMAKRGLTEEDQAKLVKEGVTTVHDFDLLEDGDFSASGINIAERREAKRMHDLQRAAEHERKQRREQVHELLDIAGLSQAGRDALANITDVQSLRAMDQRELAEHGLGIMDRRKLILCETAPQRRARARKQRQERKKQEHREVMKRRLCRFCAFIVACLGLLWALTWVPKWCGGQGYHWGLVITTPMTDCNSSVGQVLLVVVVKVMVVAAYEACFWAVLDKLVCAAQPSWAFQTPRQKWAVLLLLLHLVPYGYVIEAKEWWGDPGRGILAAVNIFLAFAKSSYYGSRYGLYDDTAELLYGIFMLSIMLWFHLVWWFSDRNY